MDWKKESEAIKDIIIRNIRKCFEHEEENHDKPIRVGNFWICIEYERNGKRNEILSVEIYLNKIRS